MTHCSISKDLTPKVSASQHSADDSIRTNTPIVLTIAGSDSGGGAGHSS